MTPTLSLVIPAYNEQARLGPYLTEIRAYLDAAYPADYEVLVVDDGSGDDTTGLVQQAAEDWAELRPLRHPANRGKGAAVRTGVLASKGERVLFADADGASPIAEEWKLSAAMARGAALACGSRRIDGPGVTRDRDTRRALAGRLFAWAARTAVGTTVKDTQCGFKMMNGPIGRELFGMGRETGYLFDVEVLALANRFGYPIAEVAINWSERPGSKVKLVRDSLRMLRDLWHLRGRLRTMSAVATAVRVRGHKAA